MRAQSDGTYEQKENEEIADADRGVFEAPLPPLVRTVAALPGSPRRALLSVPWDCAGRIAAEFVTPEIAFVMQESEVKVRRPPQVRSVIRMWEGSRVLSATAAAPPVFTVTSQSVVSQETTKCSLPLMCVPLIVENVPETELAFKISNVVPMVGTKPPTKLRLMVPFKVAAPVTFSWS